MNRKLIGILFAGLVATSAEALADDTTMTTAQKHQMMKDCMQKQKMKDSTMSKDDMKVACKDETTMNRNSNDLTSASPRDTAEFPQQPVVEPRLLEEEFAQTPSLATAIDFLNLLQCVQVRSLIEIVAVAIGDRDLKMSATPAEQPLKIEPHSKGPLIGIGRFLFIAAARIVSHFRYVDGRQVDAAIEQLRTHAAPVAREGAGVLSRGRMAQYHQEEYQGQLAAYR